MAVFSSLAVGILATDQAGNTSTQITQTVMKESMVVDTTLLTPKQGFIIQGDTAGDQLGFQVSGAGDINGDGISDLIVGATQGDDGGLNAGEAYVIFGGRTASTASTAPWTATAAGCWTSPPCRQRRFYYSG